MPTQTWEVFAADSSHIFTSTESKSQIIYRNYPDIAINDHFENKKTVIKTFIYKTGCIDNDTSEIKVADNNGNFSMGNSFNNIKINRDIPGDYYTSPLSCTDVMGVINAADRNKALAIANNSYTSPSIYELISADVNLDGKVTAGDVALISSRTINSNNCEFPQYNNYNWNGKEFVPRSTYKKSKDWVFLAEGQLINNGIAYSRNNVPYVDNCIYSYSSSCIPKYSAILLGDDVPNILMDNSAMRIAASENVVSIDYANITNLGNKTYSAPVTIAGNEKISAIDFSFNYSNNIKVKGIQKIVF